MVVQMSHYFGIQKVTFDERGRLALPSAVKTEHDSASPVLICEGAQIILSAHADGCITLFQEIEWLKEIAKLNERYRSNSAQMAMLARMESFAEKQTLDSMGRLLIPDPILRFAQISVPSKKGAYLSVEANHLRVWGEEAWNAEIAWFKSMSERRLPSANSG